MLNPNRVSSKKYSLCLLSLFKLLIDYITIYYSITLVKIFIFKKEKYIMIKKLIFTFVYLITTQTYLYASDEYARIVYLDDDRHMTKKISKSLTRTTGKQHRQALEDLSHNDSSYGFLSAQYYQYYTLNNDILFIVGLNKNTAPFNKPEKIQINPKAFQAFMNNYATVMTKLLDDEHTNDIYGKEYYKETLTMISQHLDKFIVQLILLSNKRNTKLSEFDQLITRLSVINDNIIRFRKEFKKDNLSLATFIKTSNERPL